MCWTRRLIVVISTRDEYDFQLTNLVDKTMSQINTSGPGTFQLMSKGLGLSDALEWSSLYDLDQFIDFMEGTLICLLPEEVVRPGFFSE